MNYQLRSCDTQGNDTGATRTTDNAETALIEFLTGDYWKLSFTLPNGKRMRLSKDGGNIQITNISEDMLEAMRHGSE